MSNAEQGPLDAVPTGSWGSITLEVPDFLEPVRQAVDAFFSFLIEILNVLISILEVLKVFATGLLDPVIAIIERIQRLIENLLLDLRQAGLYIHGDFYILQGPDFQSLRGGYLAYERRMYARLVDRNDPDRPDISEDSTVLAVLLFVQVDIFGVNRIVQLIKSILALFNRQYPVPRMQLRPYKVQATYGYDGATVFSFNKSYFKGFLPRKVVDDNINSPYNAVNLTWEMPPIPGAPFPDTPIMPPAGFLVEFSTSQTPLYLKCERPVSGTLEAMQLPNQPAKREVFDVLDEEGNRVGLTGGVDQISISEGVNFNDIVTLSPDNPLKPDSVRIYATRSVGTSSPIDISLLKEGDRYFLQRTFFVPFSQNLFFPGRGYGATFTFDQMPYAADFELDPSTRKVARVNDTKRPDRFWVQIRAVTRSIKSSTDFQYLADQVSLRDNKGPTLTLKNPTEVELNDRGPSSGPVEVLFPDASTERYLRAVAEALAIVALSRPDLPVLLGRDGEEIDFGSLTPTSKGTIPIYWGELDGRARKATGLEDIATYLMPQIVGRRQIQSFYAQDNANVQKFRKKLFNSCIALTNRLYTKNNPPIAARRIVLNQAFSLLDFSIFIDPNTGKVSTTTDPDVADLRRGLGHTGGSLLELLQQDNTSLGIGPNPLSVGIPEGRASARHSLAISRDPVLPRSPHFFFSGNGNPNDPGRGSADSSPVVYSRSNAQVRDIEFIRNLIPDEVYEQARIVLQIATGPITRTTEGGWIALRLFPMGLPEIDKFFDRILALLRSIQAAVDSIAETIVRYIEFLQSRLRELQAFLNRLNALIQRLLRFFFSITPAAGLVLVGQGTEGIISGLTASQNKPLPPAGTERDSYAGGVILVAGGIPNVVLDIFRAFFSQA